MWNCLWCYDALGSNVAHNCGEQYLLFCKHNCQLSKRHMETMLCKYLYQHHPSFKDLRLLWRILSTRVKNYRNPILTLMYRQCHSRFQTPIFAANFYVSRFLWWWMHGSNQGLEWWIFTHTCIPHTGGLGLFASCACCCTTSSWLDRSVASHSGWLALFNSCASSGLHVYLHQVRLPE